MAMNSDTGAYHVAISSSILEREDWEAMSYLHVVGKNYRVDELVLYQTKIVFRRMHLGVAIGDDNPPAALRQG